MKDGAGRCEDRRGRTRTAGGGRIGEGAEQRGRAGTGGDRRGRVGTGEERKGRARWRHLVLMRQLTAFGRSGTRR